MRAMDDDDEEYQPLEDENNLNSDDHLSEYSDEEELVIYNCIVYSKLTNISLDINVCVTW